MNYFNMLLTFIGQLRYIHRAAKKFIKQSKPLTVKPREEFTGISVTEEQFAALINLVYNFPPDFEVRILRMELIKQTRIFAINLGLPPIDLGREYYKVKANHEIWRVFR